MFVKKLTNTSIRYFNLLEIILYFQLMVIVISHSLIYKQGNYRLD